MESSPFDRYAATEQEATNKILIRYYGRENPSIHRGYEISILGDQLDVALNKGSLKATSQPKLFQELQLTLGSPHNSIRQLEYAL